MTRPILPVNDDLLDDDLLSPHVPRRRSSLYDPKYVRMAEVYCQLGATTAELANLFNVSLGTVDKWARTYPEFGKSMQQGKAAWDNRVERSLAERALGYEVDVEEVKISKDGEIVRYKVRKKYPPDTTACIFWLKNRRREQWRDVQDHNHEGKLSLENVTAEQLLEQIRTEAEELGIVAPQGAVKRPLQNKVQH